MTESKPEWVKMKPAEMEKLVVDLYKQGNTPSKIGIILRDQHGIPRAKLLGKKITHILSDAKIQDNSDQTRVQNKIKNLEEHQKKHKHDYTAKKSLTKNLWLVKPSE
ncbi:30S ribosomal protein S15 [Candidatus Pacearchaeota archaeon]|nr:30S ribosomal protein S15 [Candidatus Pacearchaeota archaeon]